MNRYEAKALGKGEICGVSSLHQAVHIIIKNEKGQRHTQPNKGNAVYPVGLYNTNQYGNLSDVKGHWRLKRAVEVAVAGRHNIFLF